MNLAILVLSLLSLLQQPFGVVSEFGSISGRVVSVGSGEPMADVRLGFIASDGTRHDVMTDGSGRFTFDRADAGQYSIAAEYDGYYRPSTRGSGPQTLRLGPGQNLQDLVLRLARAGTIAGRIYDENNQPLPGVRVEAMRYEYRDGRRVLATAGAATQTNDRGEYRIYWLDPGQYQVRATYIPRTSRGAADGSYAPLFYPGTIGPPELIPVNLTEGAELLAVDFTMLPIGAIKIRGRIINAVTNNSAVRASQFFLVPRDPDDANSPLAFANLASGDSPGAFEIRGVLPNSYYLYALLDLEGATYAGRVSIDVSDRDVDDVGIPVRRGSNIRVEVRWDETDAGADRATAALRVGLRPSGLMPPALAPPQASMDRLRRFQIPNVAEGTYALAVEGLPPNAYIKSVRFGLSDGLADGIVVDRQGASLMTVEISTSAGMVGGLVLGPDGKQVPDSRVVLVPERRYRKNPAAYKVTSTDQYGVFNVRGVPPGNYKVFAWEDVEQGAYLSPAFIDSVEPFGRDITVNPNSNLAINVVTTKVP